MPLPSLTKYTKNKVSTPLMVRFIASPQNEALSGPRCNGEKEATRVGRVSREAA